MSGGAGGGALSAACEKIVTENEKLRKELKKVCLQIINFISLN